MKKKTLVKSSFSYELYYICLQSKNTENTEKKKLCSFSNTTNTMLFINQSEIRKELPCQFHFNWTSVSDEYGLEKNKTQCLFNYNCIQKWLDYCISHFKFVLKFHCFISLKYDEYNDKDDAVLLSVQSAFGVCNSI